MCKPCVLLSTSNTHTKLWKHTHMHKWGEAYVNKCLSNAHDLKRPTITRTKVISLTYFINYYMHAHTLPRCSGTSSSVILSAVIACHAEAFSTHQSTLLMPTAKIVSKTACHFWFDSADPETITSSGPVRVSSRSDSSKNKHWFPFI